MSKLIIDHEKCSRCGECITACPFDVLEICDGFLKVYDGCTLCGACVGVCPENALCVEVKDSADVRLKPEKWEGVWVVAELNDTPDGPSVAAVSLELIGEGRRLANILDTDLSVVVMGSGLEKTVGELRRYEINRIIKLDTPELRHYQGDIFAAAFAGLVEKGRPEIVICGATANGRAFFPRGAALLHTGLTADCTKLDIDKERRVLLQTRPAFGGNIMATIESAKHRPQMATVRPNVMAAPVPGKPGQVEVVEAEPSLVSSKMQVLECLTLKEGADNLAEADVIVAGGRGLGGRKGVKHLKRLAKALGGTVGASRAAVDSGWLPYSAQVGQTGKVVQPKLYVACGISGAVQHLVGMRNAETVVAINSDPKAPIFDSADFGFVGDLNSVIPELAETFEKKLSK